jgi:hypothetical protein
MYACSWIRSLDQAMIEWYVQNSAPDEIVLVEMRCWKLLSDSDDAFERIDVIKNGIIIDLNKGTLALMELVKVETDTSIDFSSIYFPSTISIVKFRTRVNHFAY